MSYAAVWMLVAGALPTAFFGPRLATTPLLEQHDTALCSLSLIDPSWYVFPGFTGFVMQTFVVRLHQPQGVPEPTRVVHNLRVAQLVAEDIAHEPLGEEK